MIAALVLTLLASYGLEPWQATSNAPFTESVVEVWQVPDGMNWKLVKVPSRPGKTAYICFKIAKQRLIQCLYLEHGTGVVEQTPILPLKEDQ